MEVINVKVIIVWTGLREDRSAVVDFFFHELHSCDNCGTTAVTPLKCIHRHEHFLMEASVINTSYHIIVTLHFTAWYSPDPNVSLRVSFVSLVSSFLMPFYFIAPSGERSFCRSFPIRHFPVYHSLGPVVLSPISMFGPLHFSFILTLFLF